eukprot:gene6300-6114_t
MSLGSALACYFLVRSSLTVAVATYHELAGCTLGRPGRLLAQCSILGQTLGATCSFCVTLAHALPPVTLALLGVHAPATLLVLLVVTVAILPLSLLRNMVG